MSAVLTREAAAAPRPRRAVPVRSAATTAAAFSASAGLVHFAHVEGHWWIWPLYGLFFLGAGIGQVLLAGLLVRGCTRVPVLIAGIAGNLAIVVLYAISRTPYGAPIGPMRGHAELPGAVDMATTAGEVVVMVALVTMLPRRIAAHATTVLLLVGGALWYLRLSGGSRTEGRRRDRGRPVSADPGTRRGRSADTARGHGCVRASRGAILGSPPPRGRGPGRPRRDEETGAVATMDAQQSRPVRVLVADDHPLYRRAIVRAVHEHPRLELAGEAVDGEDALAQVRRRQPDIAVLDVRMPGLDGMEVLASLARDAPETRVMLLSAFSEGELVYKALAAGAAGYLSKDADEREITRAILAIAAGETVVSSELSGEVLGSIREQALRKAPVLSPREREILALAAEGKSGPEIGRELYLSPATVKTYFERIYDKLEVSDRAAAVAQALRRGLL